MRCFCQSDCYCEIESVARSEFTSYSSLTRQGNLIMIVMCEQFVK